MVGGGLRGRRGLKEAKEVEEASRVEGWKGEN